MLSILAADILHLICVELRLSSLPDLCSFALTNHAVSSIARVHIFYTLTLRILNMNTKNRLEMLQANPEWCTFIREIRITGQAEYRNTKFEESHVWALIEVGRARGELRPMRIEWDAHTIVKADLQQALVDAFPSAALFIHLHAYKGDPIPYSPHLISLHAVVHLHTDALWHFKPALLNAPNLCHLKIQQYRSRGCVIMFQPPPPFLQSSTFRESSDDSRSLPLLEELEIKYFDFRQDVHFMQRLNWSKLSSLKIDYCRNSTSLLQNLAPQFSSSFPSLRRLRIAEHPWFKLGELDDLLMALGQILEAFDPGFEELVFVGPFTGLMDVIGVSQGRSLRRLKMHDIESSDGKMERRIAAIRALENMGNRCKYLERLYLDVNSIHSGSGTDVSLRDIHSLLMHTSSSSSPMFPHLKALTISMPVGIATEIEPSIEQIAEAKAMCSELLVGHPEHKRMLKSIRLEIGEQGREIGGGRPAPWVLWEQGMAHAWAFEKEGDSDAVSEIGPVRGRPSLI
jgi:hypothetical protein